jgi:hypothetical protein
MIYLVLLVSGELQLFYTAFDDIEFLAIFVQSYDHQLELSAGQGTSQHLILALLNFFLDFFS